MKTEILRISALAPEPDKVAKAAKVIKNGGLVIIPTETVYGIAANMYDMQALERLYRVKKRPQDKNFSLHIADKHSVYEYAAEVPPAACRLMLKFWPGPLTIIFKSPDATIGMRMPDHQAALEIIRETGNPLVCPSANISGKPAPRNIEQALEDLNGLVDLAVDAGPARLGVESSVVDATVSPVKILREGAVPKEEIEKVSAKKTILFVCTGNSCRSVMAKGLLEKKMRDKGRNDFEVLSAGIMNTGGLGATEETKELLKNEGIDVSAHRSQALTKDLVGRSDLVLVMEKIHEQRIKELYPQAKNRIFLLKEFACMNTADFDIQDPIGRSRDFYANTFSIIKEAVERVSKLI